MKSYWKQEWINALTNGKYKQAAGTLRQVKSNKKKPTFCCLGVLCDVAGVKWERDKCVFGKYSLSPDALKFFGIRLNQQDALVNMNDNKGKSFKEIAEYIRKKM